MFRARERRILYGYRKEGDGKRLKDSRWTWVKACREIGKSEALPHYLQRTAHTHLAHEESEW